MRGRWYWAATLGLVVLGAWARCADFRTFLTPEAVLLKPTDSHYYVRFALQQLAVFPGWNAYDPWVNWPAGASIHWPTLHTWAVGLAVLLAGVDHAEAGAAFVGPSIYVLEALVLASFARRAAGGGQALVATGVMALVPALIIAGGVGNADHHVHEAFLAAGLALASARAAGGSRRAAIAVGLLLAISRLLTTATVFLIPCAWVSWLSASYCSPVEARTRSGINAVWAGAAAALAFVPGIVLFGAPASLDYLQLSPFLALEALAGFIVVAGLHGLGGGSRRLLWALLPGLGLAAAVGGQALRAAGHLSARDPLLSLVVESQPLWRHPDWARFLLGALLVVAPVAVAGALWATYRRRSPLAAATLAPVLLLAGATTMQTRFVQALCGPLALLVPLGLSELSALVSARARRVALGVGVVFALTSLPSLWPTPAPEQPSDEAMVRPTMLWLKEHTPPQSAVVATHDLGHLLTLWAQRPAVATPFSQVQVHLDGNERASRVLAAYDDEQAFEALQATGARYVLVIPFQHILGRSNADDERTLARHLLEDAAMSSTGHFRLVHDSFEERRRKEKGPYARVFEAVEGAELSGKARPGVGVRLKLTVRTNTGRALTYERRAVADSGGSFVIRVAYPSGESGEVSTAPHYELESGSLKSALVVSDADVRNGERLMIDLTR